jgi:periplasmic divalent cation tolerance protein
MDQRMIYMTAGSQSEAERIANALVSEHLAACVNVLPSVQSVYRWQGQVERATEVALIAKTRADLVEKLTERVLSLHSYECPCIVSLALDGGNPAFLSWITTETSPAAV